MQRTILACLICLAPLATVDIGAAAGEKSERLAIKGYDPVAYFTLKKPVIGDPSIKYRFDGAVYRFATRRHMTMFRADPDRYVPVFRGLCTAALSRGVKVVADPNNWLIYKDRLHIFGKPIVPGLMRKDQASMLGKARKHWDKLGRPRAEGQK